MAATDLDPHYDSPRRSTVRTPITCHNREANQRHSPDLHFSACRRMEKKHVFQCPEDTDTVSGLIWSQNRVDSFADHQKIGRSSSNSHAITGL